MARKKKLAQISVRTEQNGYSLSIEGHLQEYFYFNTVELVEGIMTHVGLQMTEQLDPKTIKSFIDSALEWNNTKACHKEIKKLETKLKMSEKQRRTLALRLVKERERMLRLCWLAKNCVVGHHSLTDALASLHARVRLDSQLKKLTLSELGVNSNQITDDDYGTEGEEID